MTYGEKHSGPNSEASTTAHGDESVDGDPILAAVAATRSRYTVVECDPSFADTAAFCERYDFGLEQSANAIVVVGKSDPRTYGCCVLLATTRLNVNSTVRGLLGARKASFASADETLQLTGMQIGGVTPFGLPADLPIWIDAAVTTVPEVIVGGGTRNRKLLVDPQALVTLPNSTVVEGLAAAQAERERT